MRSRPSSRCHLFSHLPLAIFRILHLLETRVTVNTVVSNISGGVSLLSEDYHTTPHASRKSYLLCGKRLVSIIILSSLSFVVPVYCVYTVASVHEVIDAALALPALASNDVACQ